MKYKLITERSHLFAPNINICFVVEFCEVFLVEDLIDAIIKVMKKYPILRSSVEFDEKGNSFYFLKDDVEVDFSLVRMCDEENWVSIVTKEQKKPFTLCGKPLIRFTCLQNERNMQLIMCIHHILADGLSCVKILQDIMSFVNEPNQEIEVVQPNLLEDSTLYSNEKLNFPTNILVYLLNKQWSKAPEIFTESEYYKMRESYWNQRSHTIKAIELNQEQVSQLILKCKKNRITVNTLIVTTLFEAAQKFDIRNTKIGMAASVRPKEMGIGNYASGVSIKHIYDTKKSIWENAATVQKLVDRKLKNEKAKSFFLTFLKALNVNLIDSIHFSLYGDCKRKPSKILGKLLGYSKNPFGLGLSNLGKIELSQLNKVSKIYFAPPLVGNTDKIVGIITTDSGLRVVYQYLNQINTEANKRIFDEWVNRLENL